MLYFGCKKRDLDYIYRNEIEEFQKEGDISHLRLAFSREQAQKVYVQNLLEEDSKLVWNMIEKEGAYVYVCGGTKMGIDVSSTLRRIAIKFGGLKDEESAKKYLSNLQSAGRFVQELWA